MANMQILSPGPEISLDNRHRLAGRLDGLAGITVGIVNNSWRCMDLVASELKERLRHNLEVTATVEVKVAATQSVAPDVFEQLATECSAVLVGIGN